MEIRECKVCGKGFKPKNPQARYCSGICRLRSQTEYQKQYLKDNAAKVKEYQRKYSKRYG